MFCALSGQETVEPVVSPGGFVFEKALINKYLAQNEKCPVTAEPLSVEELIPLKVNKAVQPRPVGGASVPGLLQLFQNEWDASVLETFNLKKQLDAVRQELAHALYQHDASCRVIARLIKERDDSRQALIELREQVQQQRPNNAMELEERNEFTADIIQQMKDLSKELSTKRPSRDKSALSSEEIGKFSEQQSVAVHKSSDPGILAVDVHAQDSNMVVTGGVDGDAVLFSKSQRKKIATLSAHSKAVTQVTFHPESTVIATGSRDKTVRLWSAPDNSVDYKVKATFSGHKAEVTGVVFHPLNEYLVSSSMDQTWAFHSIETGQTLVTASAPSVSSPILSCDVHPDCLLLATGQQNGGVGLWNISTQSVVMSFGDHAGGVRGLKFSESGYEVITAGANEIALWDLRKMNQKKAIAQLPGKFDLSSIALTHSGAYVAASGSGIKIFDVASFEEVVTLSSHADRVTGIKWDRSGSSLASVSLDRNLKIFA